MKYFHSDVQVPQGGAIPMYFFITLSVLKGITYLKFDRSPLGRVLLLGHPNVILY